MARIYKGGLEKFCKAIVQKETLSTSRMQQKISVLLLPVCFHAYVLSGTFQMESLSESSWKCHFFILIVTFLIPIFDWQDLMKQLLEKKTLFAYI